MQATLEFHGRGPLTYESAHIKEDNIVHQLAYLPAATKLRREIWERRDDIEALTRHHLGLGDEHTCMVLEQPTWIQGSFNICVPIEAKSKSGCWSSKVIFRCPMPHKLAEQLYPGTIDEKVGCEVGAYTWIQDKCPEIRIPHLYGFGFSDSRHFTHAKHRSLFVRFTRMFWRSFYRLLQYPVLSQYTPNPIKPTDLASSGFHSAYMILEYIDHTTGRMLSETWDAERRGIQARRQNLFRGMATIILSLARIPQPRIGSFQFNYDCTVTLTSRPLTCTTIILENEGTPRTIQKSDTFTSTEAFVSDMITFHDNRLISNPNAVSDASDCRNQMSQRAILRALSHYYIRREYRNGPFLLQLTDFHASNIFVDEEWNITCLIDLEWICALPVEIISVPYWLTGQGIDELAKEEPFNEFSKIREEFMQIFEEEERKITLEHEILISGIMHNMWVSKGVWFWSCLKSVNAMLALIADHIAPRYSFRLLVKVEEIVSKLWCEDAEAFVEQKVADERRYDQELRRLFEISAAVEARNETAVKESDRA